MTDFGELTPEEQQVCDRANSFARENKVRITKELTDIALYPADRDPVVVFMAGSPGAGKTEASKELIAKFERDGSRVLRIDPDELRTRFPEYDGRNSHLFQRAISSLVSRTIDLAYDNDQSFILDGTLSNLVKARENVERAHKHKRAVQILYVYLDPLEAWKFVQAREALEGRRIRPATFIDQYFQAREVVNALKREFGPNIAVDLLQKPIDGSERLYKAGIDQIDNHVPETYTREQLTQALSEICN